MSVRTRPAAVVRTLAVCAVCALALVPAACSGEDTSGSPAVRDTASSVGSTRDTRADSPTDTTDTTPAPVTDTTPITAGGTIPPEFPTDVPLPTDHTVNVATETVTDGLRTFVVQIRAPGDPVAVFEALTARFDEGGWVQLQRSITEHDGEPSASAIYSNDAVTVSLGTIAGSEPGMVTVSYSVRPEPVR